MFSHIELKQQLEAHKQTDTGATNKIADKAYDRYYRMFRRKLSAKFR